LEKKVALKNQRFSEMSKGCLKEGALSPTAAEVLKYANDLVLVRVINFHYKIREKRKLLLKTAEFD